MLLLIDGSGERRLEPKHGRVSRGVTPDDCREVNDESVRNKVG